MNDITTYDDFFSRSDYAKILGIVSEPRWRWGHGSKNVRRSHPGYNSRGFPFWRIDLDKESYFTNDLLNIIQERTQQEYNLFDVYANGHTFGTMGDFHRDWNDETGRTFLLYVNNGWSIDWGGHTIFDLGDGKYHYHLPRPNSATFFPGIIPHMAEATSRKFGGLRVTIAWKLLLK